VSLQNCSRDYLAFQLASKLPEYITQFSDSSIVVQQIMGDEGTKKWTYECMNVL